VKAPAVQEEMIEGRQRDQGHRRSAEHAVEYDDEKLRNAELHATWTFAKLQCKKSPPRRRHEERGSKVRQFRRPKQTKPLNKFPSRLPYWRLFSPLTLSGHI
jgi:hypothetical protein